MPFLQITAGTLIAALSVSLFLLPHQLASGGLGGLLLVLHYLWGIPIGPVYFVANLPALYLLFRIYGMKGLARTLWGITTFSLFLQVTKPLAQYTPTTNLLLATIYGGLLMGLGIGLSIMVGGSTGGTTPIAQVLRHYTGFDVSRFLLLTDIAVLALAALVLSVEVVLYGFIMTYVMAKAIQALHDSLNISRCLMIISDQPDAVAKSLLKEIRRGVTRLDGTGEFSGERRPVLMCVIRQSEVFIAKRLVLQADPDAFVLITDAREVNGRGFTLDTPERPLPYWQQGL